LLETFFSFRVSNIFFENKKRSEFLLSDYEHSSIYSIKDFYLLSL